MTIHDLQEQVTLAVFTVAPRTSETQTPSAPDFLLTRGDEIAAVASEANPRFLEDVSQGLARSLEPRSHLDEPR